MKPATTLKKLLKPPFWHDQGGVGEVFVKVNDEQNWTRIMQVRGWGFFQYFKNGEQLQDDFKDFVIKALNEKWERDYGETKIWIRYDCHSKYECPECHAEYYFPNGPIVSDVCHCPHCGTKLLPPE